MRQTSDRLTFLKNKAKLLQKAKQRGGQTLKLKEAFEILARTAGFSSWREWRSRLDQHDLLLWSKASAHWHTWYSDRAAARAHLSRAPQSFLLPYEKDYFICDLDYLRSIGIEESHPDVQAVGRDWSEPADENAFRRILERIRIHRDRGTTR